VSAIRNRDEQGNSESHFAVGRIRYDLVDPQIPEGMLLYLKSSLTGNEPADVLRYKAQHKEFPHQTTADQWFNESQFESYRTLGYAALCSTFEPTRSRVQKGDLHGAIRTLARSQMEKRETGRAQR
jgi:hypothetical protein